MEFIKGRSMPTSTTTRAQTVHSIPPFPGIRTQGSNSQEEHPYVLMMNRLYAMCSGTNARQKKEDIQMAVQAVLDNKITVPGFFSQVAVSLKIELPQNFKIYFGNNVHKFRVELYKKTVVIPGLKPPQAPIAPQLSKVMTSSHTIKKVATPNSIPMPRVERTVADPKIAAPTRPKNSRQFPKSFTMPTPAKILKSDVNESKKESEGVDHLLDADVMCGINLEKESLSGTEHIGAQERSIKETPFLNLPNLLARCRKKCNHVVFPTEAMVMISQAAEEYLKGIVDELASYVDLRVYDESKHAEYKKMYDIPAQIQFLEDVERIRAKKLRDLRREEYLRIANVRSKTLDSQNAKIRARVKEMQAAENAKLRHREANSTALKAIAPRKTFNFCAKKPDLKNSRLGVKRARLNDAIALLERNELYKRSTFLALLYLK